MLIWPLEKNEALLWQGRPAPRCFLFRHWRSQLGAAFALLLFTVLFLYAWQRNVSSPTLVFLLLPLLLALLFGPLRLVYIRWRWETIFYAATDCRLIIRSRNKKPPVAYPWRSLKAIVLHPYSDHLANIELIFADGRRVMLECLEEPTTCLRALPATATNPQGQQHPV